MQIRLIDLNKGAVKPYTGHACNINSILPLSTAVFASGGADGTIMCHDSRVHSRSNASGDAGQQSLLGKCCLLTDQGDKGLPPRRTCSVPKRQIYPHVGLPCALAKHSQPNLQDWCCH